MVTSIYKVSDLGLTLKVKFREKNIVIQTNKDINGCLICDVIRPGATIKLRLTKFNKYVSNYIVYFSQTLLYITYSSSK